MEVVLIVPIGGALIALGVLALIGIVWLWNAVTSNPDAISIFANESTDTTVLVLGAIMLVLALFMSILLYSESWKKRKRSIGVAILTVFFRAVIMAIPFTLGLSVVYAWCMQWADGIVGIMAESILMWISVPLAIIVALIGAIIGLVPMGILLFFEFAVGEAADDEGGFWGMVIFEVLAIGLYILLMYTCTDLPEYLYNSFAAW